MAFIVVVYYMKLDQNDSKTFCLVLTGILFSVTCKSGIYSSTKRFVSTYSLNFKLFFYIFCLHDK